MLFWTHRFDLLAKLVGLGALAVCWVALGGGRVEGLGAWIWLSTLMLLGWALVWRPILRVAASWAYLRRELRATGTWRDAHALSILFTNDLGDGMKWHPCTDVAGLPPELRLPALHQRLSQVLEARSAGFFERSRRTSPIGRPLSPEAWLGWNIVMLAGIAIVAVGMVAGVGPGTVLVGLLVDEKGRYSPMLVLVLGVAALGAMTWPIAYVVSRIFAERGGAQ